MLAIQANAHQQEIPLKERFSNKVVDTIKEIVADNERRMGGYPENIKLLNEGCYYSSDYMKALKTSKQTPRLDFFVKKNAFHSGWADSRSFKQIKSATSLTGVTPNFFLLKEGVTAAQGLEAIRRGPSFIGCAESCQIAFYEALKHEIGLDKFNAIFSAHSEKPFAIGWDPKRNPILPLLSVQPEPAQFNKGDIVYFKNTQEYNVKHINGDSTGYFTICCDSAQNQETFTSLGLKSSGAKIDEIRQRLLDGYNEDVLDIEGLMSPTLKEKIKQGYTPDEQEWTKRAAHHKLDLCSFLQIYGGGQIPMSFSPNFDRISQLSKEPLATISQLFAGWN